MAKIINEKHKCSHIEQRANAVRNENIGYIALNAFNVPKTLTC